MEKEKNKESADPRPDELGAVSKAMADNMRAGHRFWDNPTMKAASAGSFGSVHSEPKEFHLVERFHGSKNYDRLGIRKIWESETDLQKRLDLLEGERQREFSIERFVIIEALEKWTNDLILCEAQFSEALTKESEGEAKRYLLRLAAPDDLADPPTLHKMTFADYQKELYRLADLVASEYGKRREQAKRERFTAPEIIQLLKELSFFDLDKWHELSKGKQSEVLSRITGTNPDNIRGYLTEKPDQKRTKKIKDFLKVGS
jgi:hypothetical protein